MNHPQYRPDIDGLRALAVTSVVTFHAFPGALPGGFVGVDIFFVISGFLISQIILGSLHQDDFSFAEFYIRRIRRIFPALLLVLSTCFVLGSFIFLADEYRQLGKHIAGGAAFISNFILWNEAGYFDSSAETKPLLHLWSLGIEEQFYIVWPLLLFWCRKTGIRLLWPIAILAGVSFSVNLFTVSGNPEAAFYSPWSRFWELMAGSYLAYLKFSFPDSNQPGPPMRSRHHAGIRNLVATVSPDVISSVGLGMLAVAFIVIDQKSLFPGAWALLPVSGTVLILMAGPDARGNRHILAKPVMTLVGLISYPLYLWHWPILSAARIITGETPSWEIRVLALIVSAFLAWGTYKLLEIPIRFHTKKLTTAVTLILLMAVLGTLGYKVGASDGAKYRLNALHQAEDPFISPKTKLKRERNICRTNHPELGGICFSSTTMKPASSREAFIFVGDSHSEALSTGFIHQFPEIPSSSFGMFGCIPFVGIERFDKGKPIGCAALMKQIYAQASGKPEATIVLTARYALYASGHGYGKAETIKTEDSHIQPAGEGFLHRVDYMETFTSGLRTTLEQLTKQNRKIIFVHQIPELGFDPKACIPRPLRQYQQQSCRLKRSDVLNRQSLYRNAAARVLNEFPQVIVFDPISYLCPGEDCTVRQGDSVLYRDDDHLSLAGSHLLSTELLRLAAHLPESTRASNTQ